MPRKIRIHRVRGLHRRAEVSVVFADYHHLRIESDEEYPAHRHGGYEAILVEAGPYLCELNGVELNLGAGDVLLVKPGDWHADHLRKGQKHWVMHFSLEAAAGVKTPDLFASSVTPSGQVGRGDVAYGSRLLAEIQAEAKSGLDHAAAVQDGLLSVLFWRWVRSLPSSSLSREWRALPREEARREFLADIFLRHVRNSPAVPDLAREAGVSVRQFTDQCRSLLGGPPARVLLEFKLREAERMLRHQRRRVSEVSDMLGFANPFHFSRVCRKAWGKPPSEL